MGSVIPIASAANYSIDELSAAYALMTKNGIATSEAGTYVKSMLGELTKAGSTTDKALRELTNKGFADLKKEGKSTSEIFELLNKHAKKNNITLKDMFGSVEAGSAAMVLASGDGVEYNEMLKAMENSAGATQDAFEKMDATPAEQLKGSLNELKNAGIKLGASLVPVMGKVVDGISMLAEKFSNLTDEQRENIVKWGAIAMVAGPALSLIGGGIKTFTSLSSVIGGASKALKIFSAGSKVAGAATTGLATAGATAGGATGLGALVTSLGGAVVAAAPFIAGAAAIGGAAYGIHKTMSKDVIPTIDLFADSIDKAADGTVTGTTKISDATKQAVSSYVEMDDSVQSSLLNLKYNNTVITSEISNELIGKFNTMGNTITAELDKDCAESLTVLQDFLKNSTSITSEQQALLLQGTQTYYDEEKKKVAEGNAQITTILQNASSQNRQTTKEEDEQIAMIREGMRVTAITQLSETEKESAIILGRIKEADGRLTAETAGEHVKLLEEQRLKTIDQANLEYTEKINVINQMDDAILKESGLTKEQLLLEAKTQRDEIVAKAKETKEEGIDELSKSYTDLSKNVNKETGEVLKNWDKVALWWDSWNPGKKTITAEFVEENKKVVTNRPMNGGYNYNGLSYVPADGYQATLHKGERVLTADENKQYRQGNNSSGNVSQTLNFYGNTESPYEVAKASKKAMRDLQFA